MSLGAEAATLMQVYFFPLPVMAEDLHSAMPVHTDIIGRPNRWGTSIITHGVSAFIRGAAIGMVFAVTADEMSVLSKGSQNRERSERILSFNSYCITPRRYGL